MKYRIQEKNVTRDFHQLFSENIIPLFEIVTEYYIERYKEDPETGEPIRVKPKGKNRREKVKLPNRDEDIITLSELNEILNGKKAFIEFFRYTDKEYTDGKIESQKVKLSFTLSRDYGLYKKRMLEINNFKNLIPTISVKEGFEFSRTDLISIISDLKANQSPMAIRITDELFYDYSEQFSKYLTSSDYIMLDIREQDIESKFMELEEFKDFETDAYKILLNSPRISEINNGEYENAQFTDKIDNSCAKIYQEYNFDGFGDFGGLKDKLPTEGGPFGCALALMYSKEHNQFFSVVNKDSKLGLRGYRTVVPELLDNREIIDPDNNCPIIDKIEKNAKNDSFGNWESWIYYTLARYIHQQATK